MGTTDKKLCGTYRCNFKDCPGHFGYVLLKNPVFHVGFITKCLKLLKCECYNCSKVLIDDYDKYLEIKAIKNPKTRQLRIYNICKAKQKCNDKIKLKKKGELDNNEKQEEPFADPFAKKICHSQQPKYKRENLKIKIDTFNKNDDENNQKIMKK